MYFAFNPSDPVVASQIAEEVEAIRAANPRRSLHVLALVDGAFDENFFKNSIWTTFPHVSLYERTRLRDFGDAGPHLIEIPSAKSELVAWLRRLIHDCDAKPMWSIIVSAVDIEEFSKHFVPFLIAECEDHLQWPVRWADARVLPNLLATLDSGPLNMLINPVYVWIAPARNGVLEKYNGNGESDFRQITNTLVVRSDLFNRLIDAAEVDAVIAQIFDAQPNILRSRAPFDNYILVSQQLVLASSFSIEAASVRKHLASMALFLRPDFAELPDFL